MALNDLAAVAPDWLRGIASEAWYERYAHRVEDGRLPVNPAKREAYARQVGGGDGFHLLDALAAPGTAEGLNQLPAILALRRVWARHFERVEDGGDLSLGSGGARLRAIRGRGRGDDRVESPYDLDARFRSKGGMGWTGYTVHLTETCDADTPRLVVHVDTTPATVHEAMRTRAGSDGRARPGRARRGLPRLCGPAGCHDQNGVRLVAQRRHQHLLGEGEEHRRAGRDRRPACCIIAQGLFTLAQAASLGSRACPDLIRGRRVVGEMMAGGAGIAEQTVDDLCSVDGEIVHHQLRQRSIAHLLVELCSVQLRG